MSDHIRDKRIMMFTSLLRTLDIVSHARMTQYSASFLEYEKLHPLIDGYTRTGVAVDHRNMREYVRVKFNK